MEKIAINSASKDKLSSVFEEGTDFIISERPFTCYQDLYDRTGLPQFVKEQVWFDPIVKEVYGELTLQHFNSLERTTTFKNCLLYFLLEEHGINTQEFEETCELFLIENKRRIAMKNMNETERAQFVIDHVIRKLAGDAHVVATRKSGVFLASRQDSSGNNMIQDILRKTNSLAYLNANNAFLPMSELERVFVFPKINIFFFSTEDDPDALDGSGCYMSPDLARVFKDQFDLNFYNYIGQGRVMFNIPELDKYALGKFTTSQRNYYITTYGKKIYFPWNTCNIAIHANTILKNVNVSKYGTRTIENMYFGIREMFTNVTRKVSSSYVIHHHFTQPSVSAMVSPFLTKELNRVAEIGHIAESTKKAILQEQESGFIVEKFLKHDRSGFFMKHPAVSNMSKLAIAGKLKSLWSSLGVKVYACPVEMDPSIPDHVVLLPSRVGDRPLVPEGLYTIGRNPYINDGSFLVVWVLNTHPRVKDHDFRHVIRINRKFAQRIGCDGDGDTLMIFGYEDENGNFKPFHLMTLEIMQSQQFIIELDKQKVKDPTTEHNIVKRSGKVEVQIAQYSENVLCAYTNMMRLYEVYKLLKTNKIDATHPEAQLFLRNRVEALSIQRWVDGFKCVLPLIVEYVDDKLCLVTESGRHEFISREFCTITETSQKIIYDFPKDILQKHNLVDVDYRVYDHKLYMQRKMIDDKSNPDISFEFDTLSEWEPTTYMRLGKGKTLFLDHSFTVGEDGSPIDNHDAGPVGWGTRVVSEAFEDIRTNIETLPLQRFHRMLGHEKRNRLQNTIYKKDRTWENVLRDMIEYILKKRGHIGSIPLTEMDTQFVDVYKKYTFMPEISYKKCLLQAEEEVPHPLRYRRALELYSEEFLRKYSTWKFSMYSVAKALSYNVFGHYSRVRTVYDRLRKTMSAKQIFENEFFQEKLEDWKEFSQGMLEACEIIRSEKMFEINHEFDIFCEKLINKLPKHCTTDDFYHLLYLVLHDETQGRFRFFVESHQGFSDWLEKNMIVFHDKTHHMIQIDDVKSGIQEGTFYIVCANIGGEYYLFHHKQCIGVIHEYDYIPQGRYRTIVKRNKAGIYYALFAIPYTGVIEEVLVEGKRIFVCDPIQSPSYTSSSLDVQSTRESTPLYTTKNLELPSTETPLLHIKTKKNEITCNVEHNYCPTFMETTNNIYREVIKVLTSSLTKEMRNLRQQRITLTGGISSPINPDQPVEVYVDCTGNGPGKHQRIIVANLMYENNQIIALAGYLELNSVQAQQTRNRAILFGVASALERFVPKYKNIVIHTTLSKALREKSTPEGTSFYFDPEWLKKVAGDRDASGTKLSQGNGFTNRDGGTLANKDIIERLAQVLIPASKFSGLYEKNITITCEKMSDASETYPGKILNRLLVKLETYENLEHVFSEKRVDESSGIGFGPIHDRIVQSVLR